MNYTAISTICDEPEEVAEALGFGEQFQVGAGERDVAAQRSGAERRDRQLGEQDTAARRDVHGPNCSV